MRKRYIDISLMAVATVAAVLSVWLSATGTEPVSMFILSIGFFLVVLLIGLAWLLWQAFNGRPAYPTVIAYVVILVVLASVGLTQWPLHASYLLSRSEFDAIARRVGTGEELSVPQRVGMFTIRKAEVSYSGVVCLWTDTNPSGRTGFVTCPTDRIPFNLWSHVALDDRWQFISED